VNELTQLRLVEAEPQGTAALELAERLENAFPQLFRTGQLQPVACRELAQLHGQLDRRRAEDDGHQMSGFLSHLPQRPHDGRVGEVGVEIAQQVKGGDALSPDLFEQLGRLPGLVQGERIPAVEALVDGPGEEGNPQLAADLPEPLLEPLLVVALDVEERIARLDEEPEVFQGA
jgi:hypothetical protein